MADMTEQIEGQDAGQVAERLELRLGQFLKLANLVGSGGAAKIVIQDGLVAVNGVIETRRGRHLQLSDTVEYRGHTVSVQQVLHARKGH